VKGSVCCLLTLLVEAEDLSSMGVCSWLCELHPDGALLASAVKCNSDVCVYEANRPSLCWACGLLRSGGPCSILASCYITLVN